MKKVAIILVNWNGWADTCECLNSFIFPLTDVHFFIVDNFSEDDSVVRLQEYAEKRSIDFQTLGFSELAENFNEKAGLTIISNTVNAGFARANNAVLQFLLKTESFDYAWLLNNDTTVTGTTLSALLQSALLKPGVTFWGSVVLDYHYTDTVQCCGVNHYKYLGVSKLFLKNKNWPQIEQHKKLLTATQDYQNGASLFIKLSALKQLGLMDERFFLYSEEADWQIRGAQKGFSNKLCTESIIYHKGSASTLMKKHLFYFHYNRSAILLTRRNFGWMASVTSTLALLLITLHRTRFNSRSVVAGINGIIEGWKVKCL